MKQYYSILIALSLGLTSSSYAQETMSISLTNEQAETLFLEQNLSLLASKLEISQAEALLLQAKTWPNPTFELSDVNLWKNNSVEEQPALIGRWGETTQFSIGIEQQIQTAGKRRKNIDLNKLSVQEKQLEFDMILRELKLELRTLFTEAQFYNEQQKIYTKQLEATESLITAYKNQVEKGNISQAEYIRLKALSLQFQKELISLKEENQKVLKELKNLLHIAPNVSICIDLPLEVNTAKINAIDLNLELDNILQDHPAILISENNVLQARKKLEIEKATQIPDLNFSIQYDRAGNIMRNFIGIGLSFELPVFDRNKGNIREALLESEIKQLELAGKKNETLHEITAAFNHFQQIKELYQSLDPNYESTLDQLLEAYHQNFKNKNVNIITYLDFVAAYMENKTTLLETQRDVIVNFETLQFLLGKDF